VEKFEKLVARQDSLFKRTGWHSKLAFMLFKICEEKPHIAFLEVVGGD
jgi:hypothetical protein